MFLSELRDTKKNVKSLGLTKFSSFACNSRTKLKEFAWFLSNANGSSLQFPSNS